MGVIPPLNSLIPPVTDTPIKTKNTRRILRLFVPYRKRLLGLFALIMVAAALGIVPAFLLQDLLNNVLPEGKTSTPPSSPSSSAAW